MTRWGPRGLFLLAVAALAAALVWHTPEWSAVDPVAAGLILGYLAWLVAEARVIFGRRAGGAGGAGGTAGAGGVAGAGDGTLMPYAVARVLTVVAAMTAPVPWAAQPRWSWWFGLPVGCFAGGIALRGWSIRELGRLYDARVVRQRGHRVVSTGPYAWVRHPSYAGMLLAHAGFVAFFLSWMSAAALVLQAAVIAWRIRSEERLLAGVRGYAEYAAVTPRLVPGVW